MSFADSAEMAMLSRNRYNGLVIDIGSNVTRVVPVIGGKYFKEFQKEIFQTMEFHSKIKQNSKNHTVNIS